MTMSTEPRTNMIVAMTTARYGNWKQRRWRRLLSVRRAVLVTPSVSREGGGVPWAAALRTARPESRRWSASSAWAAAAARRPPPRSGARRSASARPPPCPACSSAEPWWPPWRSRFPLRGSVAGLCARQRSSQAVAAAAASVSVAAASTLSLADRCTVRCLVRCVAPRFLCVGVSPLRRAVRRRPPPSAAARVRVMTSSIFWRESLNAAAATGVAGPLAGAWTRPTGHGAR